MNSVDIFQSYQDFMTAAAGPAPAINPLERSSRNNDKVFSGGESWESALKKSQVGDLNGAKQLRPAIMESLAKTALAPRYDVAYELDGGLWVDVDRFNTGDPEHWGTLVTADPVSTPRALSIVVNCNFNGGISGDQVHALAGELGGAILSAQASGHAVALFLAFKNKHRKSTRLIGLPVNEGGDPLDVARLSAVLRPWFKRRILFSFVETKPANYLKAHAIGDTGGYGVPIKLDPADALKITGDPNAYIFNMLEHVYYPKNIKAVIERQLKGAN